MNKHKITSCIAFVEEEKIVYVKNYVPLDWVRDAFDSFKHIVPDIKNYKIREF